MKPTDFHVGQELFFVEQDKRRTGAPHVLVIEKIGRTWLTCRMGKHTTYRVSLGDDIHDPLDVDGGQFTSPGRCYLTEQEAVDAPLADAEWSNILRTGYLLKPTLAQVRKIADILRGTEEV